MKTDIRIEHAMGKDPVDRRGLADHLLARCVAFFEDTENDRAFKEWMKQQKRKKKEA